MNNLRSTRQTRSNKHWLQIPHLNFVPLGQERIETQYQIIIPMKQPPNSVDNTNGIHFLGFEILHNFEEFIVDSWSIAEFQLDLI